MLVDTKQCINEASELRMMQFVRYAEEEGSLLQAGDSPACQESEEDREAVLTELRTWWWSVKSGQVRSVWHSCMSWMQALIPSFCLLWRITLARECLALRLLPQQDMLDTRAAHRTTVLCLPLMGINKSYANIHTYTRQLTRTNNATIMVRRAQRWQHYQLKPEREGWVRP